MCLKFRNDPYRARKVFYPSESAFLRPYTTADCQEMIEGVTLEKLFVGQLPHGMSEGECVSLIGALAQRHIFRAQKIRKWSENGRSLGCFHVFVAAEDVKVFFSVSDKALCVSGGALISQNSALLHAFASRTWHRWNA